MSAKNKLRSSMRRYDMNRDLAAAKDIDLERQRQAVATTARFVNEHLASVKAIRGNDATEAMLALMRDGLAQAPMEGLVLEFGVATGLTIREIAKARTPVYGFDSFEGLPEDWRSGYAAGAFAQEPPNVDGVEMVVGWFNATLPKFLDEHPGPFAFVHMDADLYSSTKTVLDLAFDRFVAGTVIVFDEYFNYPGWQEHEHKAFVDFLARYSGGFEYVNYNAIHEQVTVRLT